MRLIVPAPENARICASADHGPPTGLDRLSQVDGQDLAHGFAINRRGLSGAPGMATGLITDSADLRSAAGGRIALTLRATPGYAAGMP
jgi:hypothetical protein